MRVIADAVSTIVILGSVVLLVIWFASDLEREYSGSYVGVDGDSVIIKGEKIRLEGLDAPELNQMCSKNGMDYRCGIKSRNHLKLLTKRGKLNCKAWKRDKYDRHLGRCYVGNIDINGKMVRDGWAVAFGSYYSEESEARDAGIGLWAGNFIRPREWRLENADMSGTE